MSGKRTYKNKGGTVLEVIEGDASPKKRLSALDIAAALTGEAESAPEGDAASPEPSPEPEVSAAPQEGSVAEPPSPEHSETSSAQAEARPTDGEEGHSEGEEADFAGVKGPFEGVKDHFEGETAPSEGVKDHFEGETAPAEAETPPADAAAASHDAETPPAEGGAALADSAPPAEASADAAAAPVEATSETPAEAPAEASDVPAAQEASTAPVAPVQAELLQPDKLSAEEEDELIHAIEAVLFAAGEPMTQNDLKKVFERLWDDTDELTPEKRRALADGLKVAYKRLVALAKNEAHEVRGFSLVHVAEGLTFRSNPRYAHVLRAMREEKPVRLSQAALETLAIVAYRQPVTKPEADHIRGVDCGGTLRLLLDRNLIRIVGKKDEPGRPMLYGTTREFLSFFNLGNLAQLPTLREFHELNPESQEELQAFEQTLPSYNELADKAKKLRLDEEPEVAALEEAVLKLGSQEQRAKEALASEGIIIEESAEGAPKARSEADGT